MGRQDNGNQEVQVPPLILAPMHSLSPLNNQPCPQGLLSIQFKKTLATVDHVIIKLPNQEPTTILNQSKSLLFLDTCEQTCCLNADKTLECVPVYLSNHSALLSQLLVL